MTKIKGLVIFSLLICIGRIPVLGTEVQSDNTEKTSIADTGPKFSDDVLKKAEQFRNSKGEDRDDVLGEMFEMNVFPGFLSQLGLYEKNTTSVLILKEDENETQDEKHTETTGQLKKEDLIRLLGEPDETHENGMMVYQLMKDSSYTVVFVPYKDSMALLGFELAPDSVSVPVDAEMDKNNKQPEPELENK